MRRGWLGGRDRLVHSLLLAWFLMVIAVVNDAAPAGRWTSDSDAPPAAAASSSSLLAGDYYSDRSDPSTPRLSTAVQERRGRMLLERLQNAEGVVESVAAWSDESLIRRRRRHKRSPFDSRKEGVVPRGDVRSPVSVDESDDGSVRGERSTNLSHFTGVVRTMQLYSKKTSLHLQILPNGTVSGSPEIYNLYAILRRSSVSSVRLDHVKLQGVATCLFLCLGSNGLPYGSSELNEECIFNEVIQPNWYNTYSSVVHSKRKHRLYVALGPDGKPKRARLREPPGSKGVITHFLTRDEKMPEGMPQCPAPSPPTSAVEVKKQNGGPKRQCNNDQTKPKKKKCKQKTKKPKKKKKKKNPKNSGSGLERKKTGKKANKNLQPLEGTPPTERPDTND